jgi:hypothetical protein
MLSRGWAQLLLDSQEIEIVGREALRPLAPRGAVFGAFDRPRAYLELTKDAVRDLSLDSKHILHRPIPALRPHVGAGLRIDELSGGADALALTLDRAFKHITDFQIAPDLPHVR